MISEASSWSIASSFLQPNVASAAGFHAVMRPAESMPTKASWAASTTLTERSVIHAAAPWGPMQSLSGRHPGCLRREIDAQRRNRVASGP
jgi:hypothetical protein